MNSMRISELENKPHDAILCDTTSARCNYKMHYYICPEQNIIISLCVRGLILAK